MWLKHLRLALAGVASIMDLPCLLFLLFALYYSCICQVTIPSTDPLVTTNGGTVDLPAVENATNVSVFCAVTFGGNTPVETIWRLRTGNMMPREIEFGNGSPDFSNFLIENGIKPHYNYYRLVEIDLIWWCWSVLTDLPVFQNMLSS